MTTTQLALIEIAIAIACFAISLAASRRLLRPAPTLGRSLGVVMLWTGFFGSLPYLVFVASHQAVSRSPAGMGAFAALVLGSLPMTMLVSPFIGLYMVLKRFSRFITERPPRTTLGS